MLDLTFIWTCAAMTVVGELFRRFWRLRRALARHRTDPAPHWRTSEFVVRTDHIREATVAVVAVVSFAVRLTVRAAIHASI